MNKVYLIGNTTKDVEFSTTTSGVNVAKFTLAVPRKYKDENNEKVVDFINVVVWRTLAENCYKYLKKGNKCAVVGSLQIRNYEDDKGKHYITEVVADEIEFLTAKPKEELEPVDIKQEELPF